MISHAGSEFGAIFRNSRAITGTKACAKAITDNVRAMPRGWPRVMLAPIIPTASTPTYMRLAELPSSPIISSARFTQMRIKAAASATAMAAQ